jgi:hypothetical protein
LGGLKNNVKKLIKSTVVWGVNTGAEVACFLLGNQVLGDWGGFFVV